MSTPLTPRQLRLRTLRAARQSIDDEITVLMSAEVEIKGRKRRGIDAEHGTESRYQQHAHYGDTADDKRRVTCEPCRAAHAEHNAAAAAVRRAMQRLSEAS